MAAKKSAIVAKKSVKSVKGKIAPSLVKPVAKSTKKSNSKPAPNKPAAKPSVKSASRPDVKAVARPAAPAVAKAVRKPTSDFLGTRVSTPPAAKPLVSADAKKKAFMGDFIGTFPMRKNGGDKKLENKKQPVGPVFPQGDYKVGVRDSNLGEIFVQEFESAYASKHIGDHLKYSRVKATVDTSGAPKDPALEALTLERTARSFSLHSKELLDALFSREVDLVLVNMKDVPLDLPNGLLLAAALRREDSRDALITRSTYGAVQELPSNAKVGTSSKRRIMQVRNLRPDIEIVPLTGDLNERMDQLETLGLDAVFCAWATLRRLNMSPRYYVALQPEQMIPAACQGGIGIICREEDKDLIAKLRYVEDSEASWSARCERAFLAKLGSSRDLPVGVFAHRKGTQDPWILDAVVGDPNSGEVLRHREIGTSRCKPESLADKAFMGILAKGARKFLPFH